MSKVEKYIIGTIVVLFLSMCATTALLVSEVKEAGGIKGIIVEVGKDIKDISQQINEEPVDKQDQVK